MKPVVVKGWGAVSPAGWGAGPLLSVIQSGVAVPSEIQPHPRCKPGLPARKVPTPPVRPPQTSHPRLRRASPISHFAAAAAVEALAKAGVQTDPIRLGVVYCVLNGCVNFSRRFYSEVLINPATASPLLFPETVANSPASHISALLGKTSPNYTLIGDHTTFVQGLGIGIDWLLQEQVDGCLVIGAEELDCLVTGGAALFERGRCASEGAGAVYLSLGDDLESPRIKSLVEPFRCRTPGRASELLQTLRTAETELILQNQPSPCPLTAGMRQPYCLAPLLGDAFTASAAWQMVLALEMMTQGAESHCTIPVIGSNNLVSGLRLSSAQA